MTSELAAWIDDAIDRLQRDEEERDERGPVSTKELLDAVWGRLPTFVRRGLTRASFNRTAVEHLNARGDNAVETALWHRQNDGG